MHYSPALPLWTTRSREGPENLDCFTRKLAESEAKCNMVVAEQIHNMGAETLH